MDFMLSVALLLILYTFPFFPMTKFMFNFFLKSLRYICNSISGFHFFTLESETN